MTAPRGHHHVSQFLLDRFTDASGKLFVFDKRRPENGIFATSPKNVFKQRDLNTAERRDGSKDYSLEQMFSDLESKAAPIVERLVHFAETGRGIRLSPEEKEIWDEFFYRQFSRAPDAYEKLGISQNFDLEWAEAIDHLEQVGLNIPEAEKARLVDPDSRDRRLQATLVKTRASAGTAVRSLLAKKGMVVASINAPNKSFVIGDHPHVRMGASGYLGASGTELWLPISHNAAITPWNGPGFIGRHILGRNDIRRMNEMVLKNSNLIAGRSRELIASLAIRKKKRRLVSPD